jgi:RNA polymerase sigma-70 factor (ECF subfamily)
MCVRGRSNWKVVRVNPIPTSEEEIIARICSGERSLFHDLIRPYTRIMFGCADAILRNPADSEEAVQEAALKVYLNLSKLEDRSRFRAWLLQIVVNEARMYRRRLRRQLYDSIEAADSENESDSVPRQFADWHELPDEALDGVELRLAVRKAVAKLPEIYREVLVLVDNQHLNYAGVADVLGVSVGVVKTRVHRARMRLQEQLGPVFQPRLSDRLRLMKGMNPWYRAKS